MTCDWSVVEFGGLVCEPHVDGLCVVSSYCSYLDGASVVDLGRGRQALTFAPVRYPRPLMKLSRRAYALYGMSWHPFVCAWVRLDD